MNAVELGRDESDESDMLPPGELVVPEAVSEQMPPALASEAVARARHYAGASRPC